MSSKKWQWCVLWKLLALQLEAAGDWRDAEGYDFWASSASYLRSLSCWILSVLLVFFVSVFLCPLNVHLQLGPSFTTPLDWKAYLACVCVFIIPNHISTHAHTNAHTHALHKHLVQWLTSFQAVTASVPTFSLALQNSSSISQFSMCPCRIFFPFHCAIIIHLPHLGCLACLYHFHPISTPHHLSRKHTRCAIFCITMKHMLTSDGWSHLVYSKKAKPNETIPNWYNNWWSASVFILNLVGFGARETNHKIRVVSLQKSHM